MRSREKLLKSIIKDYEDQNIVVGKNLHEYIAQDLYAIRLSLQRYSIENGHSLPVDQVLEILDGTIGKVKQVANDLLPVVLRDFGFQHAVSDLLLQYNAIKNNVVVAKEIAELDYNGQLHLFQLVQLILKATFVEDDSSIMVVKLKVDRDHIMFEMEGVNERYISELNNVKEENIKKLQDRVKLFEGTLNINTNFNKNGIEVIVKLN